jgi:hypothetical protein
MAKSAATSTGSTAGRNAMTSQVALDRIQGYLRQLTPQERSRLLVEMERLQQCGQGIAGADDIVQTLRTEIRGSGQAAERIGNPARFFFEALQPVLVDWSPERANRGQISRGSLTVIWDWINQFLLPTLAREYATKVEHLNASNDVRGAQRAAAEFQVKVVKSLENMMRSNDGVVQARANFARFTSSQATIDDLSKMAAVLRNQEALASFVAALPDRIKSLDGDVLGKTRKQLSVLRNKHAEVLPFALVVLTRRLKSAWQLMRLATKIADSKDVSDIAATPYALAVDMVLDHLDDRRAALCQALRINKVPIARDILTDIYDIEYAFRVRIDGLEGSDWGKRLESLMEAVAVDLNNEMHNIPGELHHVLSSPSLRSHNTLTGRLTYLGWKVRDVLTLQPAALKRMLSLSHRAAS